MYNYINKNEPHNLNYQSKEYTVTTIYKEEEIIPRKLRFSDSSFNKFNVATNKKVL